MTKYIDMAGQRFGRLTVIRKVKLPGKRDSCWECKCDCGNTAYVTTAHLRNGTVSCGCYRNDSIANTKGGKPPIKDITGKRFGKLIAIRPTDKRSSLNVVWECKCDCGNTTYVPSGILLTGKVVSCGCHKNKLAGERANEKFADYRKENFVESTNLYDITNRPINSRNKTGVRGVSFHKQTGKYIAQLKFQGQTYWLGEYKELADAAAVRKEAEEKIFDGFLEWYNNRKEQNNGEQD